MDCKELRWETNSEAVVMVYTRDVHSLDLDTDSEDGEK
jgi:hypothetical protein